MKNFTKIVCGIMLMGALSFAAYGCGDVNELPEVIETETVDVTESTSFESTTSTVETTTTTVETSTSDTTSTEDTTTVETTTFTTEATAQAVPSTFKETSKDTTTCDSYTEEVVNIVDDPITLVATTEPAPETTTVVSVPQKSVEEIAKEVWQGKWGNGADRKARLIAAGYDYSEVQKAVDALRPTPPVSTTPTTNTDSTVVDGYPMSYVKQFSRGTYYAYGGPRNGGSGRSLIDCSQGSGGIKGSIASSYLYRNYGYNYNGKRTMVYLEISGYPSMSGYYYLDDSDAGNSNVIDFFYLANGNCQFQYQGVVTVDCWIVSY